MKVRERKRRRDGGEKKSKGMIAREIRPSIGSGSYQRNKGTAGGKGPRYLGKEVPRKGGWWVEGRYGGERYQRGEKKRGRKVLKE